jgi:3-oxoacyl-[acyl-carrier protein] reductase
MRIIRGRKAVVTGAASGIGKAIALALAAEGADLFLIDRDAEGLAAAAREAAGHGIAVLTATCDLAVPSEVTQAISRVRATWDTVNILVNCAGVARYGAFHLTTEEAWRRTMAVNLLAPMQIIHETMGALLAAEEAHILNVCSIMGLVQFRKTPVYQASKFGLVGFTLALRSDYYRDNFGLTAMCPGFVRTPLLDNMRDAEAHKPQPSVPDWISITPEAVAVAAVSAIRRNKGLVIVTMAARLAWYMTRLSPGLLGWFVREGWRRRARIAVPMQRER